jgi:pyridoxine/pyridoxamine 5'-phosphate oxidase
MMITQDLHLNEVLKLSISEIKRGSVDKNHPFKYVVLSTQDGVEVHSRYVVLRSIDEYDNVYFFTDERSHKTSEIRINPHVGLLFYHPRKRVQIRISGIAQLHHEDEVSNSFWDTVSGQQKLSYGSSLTPGHEIKEPGEAFHWPDEITSENFCVIKVFISEIEVLQLNRDQHLRARFQRDGTAWKGNWLVP